MFFHRFSGVAAFNFYAVTIFKEAFAGGSYSPHWAAVGTGFVQLVASGLSGLLCDLFGRMPLLIISTGLMSAALAGFGFFAYYQTLHPNGTGDMDWIPLVCVILFVCAFSLGMNPISWLLVGEIFPLQYRDIGPSLSTAFSYVCAFAAVKTFVDFREHLGLCGTFWIYSVISLIGLIFCLAFVPETKGQTLDEMATKDVFLQENRHSKV